MAKAEVLFLLDGEHSRRKVEYYSLSKKSHERKMTVFTPLKGLLARLAQLHLSVLNEDQKLNGVAQLSSNLKIPAVTFNDLRLRLDPWLLTVYFLVTLMEQGTNRKLQQSSLQSTVSLDISTHIVRRCASKIQKVCLSALLLIPTIIFTPATSQHYSHSSDISET